MTGAKGEDSNQEENSKQKDNKLGSARVSPTSDLSKHVIVRKPKGSIKKNKGNNFIDQMHKRVTKPGSRGSKNFHATLGGKTNNNSSRRNNPSPGRKNRISLSNSPVNQLGKRPNSKHKTAYGSLGKE